VRSEAENGEWVEEVMTTSLEKIYEQAMRLPDESKAVLAERIVEYLEINANHDLERLHLDIVKGRRDQIREGRVMPVDGKDALARARRIINQ
jgi:hypothetical protein